MKRIYKRALSMMLALLMVVSFVNLDSIIGYASTGGDTATQTLQPEVTVTPTTESDTQGAPTVTFPEETPVIQATAGDTTDAPQATVTITPPQTERHHHTFACYEGWGVRCGYEQGQQIDSATRHYHTGDCYEGYGEIVCGLQEGEEHVHDSSCKEVADVYICGKTYHKHNSSCTAQDGSGEATRFVYNLNFDNNGGEGGPTRQVYETNEESHTFSIPDEKPTRSGYYLASWYDEETGTLYKVGDSITLTVERPDVRLKAIWAYGEEPVVDQPLANEGLDSRYVCGMEKHEHTSECVEKVWQCGARAGAIAEGEGEVSDNIRDAKLVLSWVNGSGLYDDRYAIDGEDSSNCTVVLTSNYHYGNSAQTLNVSFVCPNTYGPGELSFTLPTTGIPYFTSVASFYTLVRPELPADTEYFAFKNREYSYSSDPNRFVSVGADNLFSDDIHRHGYSEAISYDMYTGVTCENCVTLVQGTHVSLNIRYRFTASCCFLGEAIPISVFCMHDGLTNVGNASIIREPEGTDYAYSQFSNTYGYTCADNSGRIYSYVPNLNKYFGITREKFIQDVITEDRAYIQLVISLDGYNEGLARDYRVELGEGSIAGLRIEGAAFSYSNTMGSSNGYIKPGNIIEEGSTALLTHVATQYSNNARALSLLVSAPRSSLVRVEDVSNIYLQAIFNISCEYSSLNRATLEYFERVTCTHVSPYSYIGYTGDQLEVLFKNSEGQEYNMDVTPLSYKMKAYMPSVLTTQCTYHYPLDGLDTNTGEFLIKPYTVTTLLDAVHINYGELPHMLSASDFSYSSVQVSASAYGAGGAPTSFNVGDTIKVYGLIGDSYILLLEKVLTYEQDWVLFPYEGAFTVPTEVSGLRVDVHTSVPTTTINIDAGLYFNSSPTNRLGLVAGNRVSISCWCGGWVRGDDGSYLGRLKSGGGSVVSGSGVKDIENFDAAIYYPITGERDIYRNRVNLMLNCRGSHRGMMTAIHPLDSRGNSTYLHNDGIAKSATTTLRLYNLLQCGSALGNANEIIASEVKRKEMRGTLDGFDSARVLIETPKNVQLVNATCAISPLTWETAGLDGTGGAYNAFWARSVLDTSDIPQAVSKDPNIPYSLTQEQDCQVVSVDMQVSEYSNIYTISLSFRAPSFSLIDAYRFGAKGSYVPGVVLQADFSIVDLDGVTNFEITTIGEYRTNDGNIAACSEDDLYTFSALHSNKVYKEHPVLCSMTESSLYILNNNKITLESGASVVSSSRLFTKSSTMYEYASFANANLDTTYALRATYQNDSGTSDNVVTYVPLYESGDWRGACTGVDISEVIAAGYNPQVYVTTDTSLKMKDWVTNSKGRENLLNGEGGFTLIDPATYTDWDKVTVVAFDFGDATFAANEKVNTYITATTPKDFPPPSDYKAESVTSIYYSDTHEGGDTRTAQGLSATVTIDYGSANSLRVEKKVGESFALSKMGLTEYDENGNLVVGSTYQWVSSQTMPSVIPMLDVGDTTSYVYEIGLIGDNPSYSSATLVYDILDSAQTGGAYKGTPRIIALGDKYCTSILEEDTSIDLAPYDVYVYTSSQTTAPALSSNDEVATGNPPSIGRTWTLLGAWTSHDGNRTKGYERPVDFFDLQTGGTAEDGTEYDDNTVCLDSLWVASGEPDAPVWVLPDNVKAVAFVIAPSHQDFVDETTVGDVNTMPWSGYELLPLKNRVGSFDAERYMLRQFDTMLAERFVAYIGMSVDHSAGGTDGGLKTAYNQAGIQYYSGAYKVSSTSNTTQYPIIFKQYEWGDKMPDSGGNGWTPYIIGTGAALIAASLYMNYKRKRKNTSA